MSYLTDDPIDPHALVVSVMRRSDGAYVLFEGVVRDHHEGKAVESIFYDAYRPMAEKEIESILREVQAQFPDVALTVVHRSASHRRRRFDRHRGRVAAPCRVVRCLPSGHRQDQRDRTDLEEGARTGWRGVGGMAGEMLTDKSRRWRLNVTPLPAASAIILRDDRRGADAAASREERSSERVGLPGGIAEESDAELGDGSFVDTMRVTAVRETFEETGVWLGAPLAEAERKRRELLDQRVAFRDLAHEAPIDLAQLVWTSRLITPAGIPKRFDTYFFLAIVGRDAIATAEQNEIVEVTWIHPSDALARHAAREMQMVFPTLRNLEAIVELAKGFASAAAVLDARRGAIIEAVEPVLVNGKPRSDDHQSHPRPQPGRSRSRARRPISRRYGHPRSRSVDRPCAGAARGDAGLRTILITHRHGDHAPAAVPLKEATVCGDPRAGQRAR